MQILLFTAKSVVNILVILTVEYLTFCICTINVLM